MIYRQNELEIQLETLLLPNYANKFIDEKISECSPFVEVFLKNGNRVIVKKTSLCWLLRPEILRLSSDRLRRVQARTSVKFRNKNVQRKTFKKNKISKRNHIRIFHYKTKKMI